MAKVILNTLASGFVDVDLLNENFQVLAAALEKTLSRDGTLPNQMEADLDLNGHGLLNSTSNPSDPASLVSLAAMQAYVDDRASGIQIQKSERFAPTNGQTALVLTEFVYEPGVSNLAVYVDGVRKFAVYDFVETDAQTVTFLSGFAGTEDVEVMTTEFIGNIALPAHTHQWTEILNTPVFTSRWPTYGEVTDKPTTFTPSVHAHSTADITSGNGLADARRGVFVQSGTPTATRVGDLWFY